MLSRLRRRHRSHTALFTDLYHPDSAYVSWVAGRNDVATFDLYTRRAPFGGAYLLVAGLEAALQYVQEFRYREEDLAFLAQIRDYDAAFLEELARLRFTGEIAAMPEGSVAFPNEPLLRVTAPFREAILIESGLLQALNLATLVATKASRIAWAAGRRHVADVGFRGAHDPLAAARAAAIGGASATSLLAAALEYGLLASSAQPEALIRLFPSREEAFRAVASACTRYTLALGAADPRRAIDAAIRVARWAREELGHTLAAVQLDLGGADPAADSRYVRAQLAAADMGDVRIAGDGDLDEYRIADLLARGAEVDALAVGAALAAGAGSVAHGAPGGALGVVYKAVSRVDEDGIEHPVIKLAGEKTTRPGRKEVYRHPDWHEDVVQLADEPAPARYARLLRAVVRGGKLVPSALPPLGAIRGRAEANLGALPEPYRALTASRAYPVRFSAALEALRAEASQAVAAAWGQQTGASDRPTRAGGRPRTGSKTEARRPS